MLQKFYRDSAETIEALPLPRILRSLALIGFLSASTVASLVFLLIAIPSALVAGILGAARSDKQPRLVWGSTPIISYAYWSKAMALAGYHSETFTKGFYERINDRSDWDRVLSEKFGWAGVLAPYPAFLYSLFRYDLFFISFNGFFLGATPVANCQSILFRLARKKTIVIAYGSDAYVYGLVRSTSLQHGLMISYPDAARQQQAIKKCVDYWIRNADVVIPFFMGFDGLGRWDVLVPNPCIVPLRSWPVSSRRNESDGTADAVTIVHAPNHRGFKGTEFLIRAVDVLVSEGLNVKLKLIEGMKNSEVRRILSEEADILADQFIATGYALNSIEGMASGLPTIANLEDTEYVMPLRRWSFLSECPLVSASPENLVDALRNLITQPDLRERLGVEGRAYVEKYHSEQAAEYLFKNVIDYLQGRPIDLINLYHPIPDKKRSVE